MGDQVTTDQLFHRLGTLETAIEAHTRAMDTYTESNEKRLAVIESKLDRPFPWLQMVSTIFGGFLVIGALFSASLQPLFTDTERNRLANIAQAQKMDDRSEVIGEFRALAKQFSETRDWLGTVSEREREGAEVRTSLKARVNEYQREAEKDRDRLESSLNRQDELDKEILIRLSAVETRAEELSQKVTDIDTRGSRRWNDNDGRP